jgi:ABC-type amino acid transport substrate-binding protein
VDLQAMDWAEAQRVMRAGGADVIDTIFRTPEREQLYAFTPPYARIRVPVYAHRSLGGLADVSSLHGFTIGVKAGDAVVEQLTNRNIDSLAEYPSYESIVLAAKSNDLKVFSVDEPAAIYYLYKHGIAAEYRQSFLLYTGEFHRAVAKDRPEILALVQRGFQRISAPNTGRSRRNGWAPPSA